MTEKANVTPALNKLNRENTKPLGERPHKSLMKGEAHENPLSPAMEEASTRE